MMERYGVKQCHACRKPLPIEASKCRACGANLIYLIRQSKMNERPKKPATRK